MTKEQTRATNLRIIAQIVPDEVLGNPRAHILTQGQVRPDSADSLAVMVELRKRYGIEVAEDDYVQLAASGSCIAYLDPRTQGL